MSDRVCPYLRTFDDPNRYVSRADESNACYSASTERPAYIPLEFQDSTCLSSDFSRCSRYKSAGKSPVGRRERQLLILSAGLGGLLLIATCVFLGIMALTLNSVGGLLGRVTDTPTAPLATPTVVITATATLTPTVTPTPSPTPTQTPSPTPTRWSTPTWTPNSAFNSPLMTPSAYPGTGTVTPHATTPWIPPATSTPWPTSTPSPSRTSGPSSTPSNTPTRTNTPIPTAGCRSDDTLTITPTPPAIGQLFRIEVCSTAGYVDVSLTGGGGPRYNGLTKTGGKYCWKWEDSLEDPGTYTYSFKINSGSATCKTASVTIASPTNTPTITPTPTPFFDLEVVPIGNQNPVLGVGVEGTTNINLRNKGNVADTFVVWLVVVDTKPPTSAWTLQYCVGNNCTDYTTANLQVDLAKGAIQELHIKFKTPDPSAQGDFAKVTLYVQSMGNASLIKSTTAQATVTGPSPTATAK